MADDELEAALVELLTALEDHGIHVYLGGGYGLYLKQLSLLESGARTLLPRDSWPRPRATADLDVFLPTEIVVDHRQMVAVREVLDSLAYEPIPEARFMHFKRAAARGHVRVELLTGPIPDDLRGLVKINRPRVRPRAGVELHAYLTQEAIAIDDQPQQLPVRNTIVRIPNAFSFILMKVHAFHDRKDDPDKRLGRHHALDVYRLVAMLTEDEVGLIRSMVQSHCEQPAMRRASDLVSAEFATRTSIGTLRLREHELAHDNMRIDEFIEMLLDLLGPRAG